MKFFIISSRICGTSISELKEIAALCGTCWDKEKFQCITMLNVSVNTKHENLFEECKF